MSGKTANSPRAAGEQQSACERDCENEQCGSGFHVKCPRSLVAGWPLSVARPSRSVKADIPRGQTVQRPDIDRLCALGGFGLRAGCGEGQVGLIEGSEVDGEPFAVRQLAYLQVSMAAQLLTRQSSIQWR